MLTEIHFILTYACNFECDHCFLYCSPKSKGAFTISQIDRVLDEAKKIGTVKWIIYEGGEPFLYYPLLKEGIKRANANGFKVAVVTNAYGANSEEDAELWLRPLAEAGVSFLNISNDTFHYGDESENPATIASSVAKRLGIEHSPICIEPPKVLQPSSDAGGKGKPVVGGGAKFRGRAVEKLSSNLPLRPSSELCKCPTRILSRLIEFMSTHTEMSISVKGSASAICGKRRFPKSFLAITRVPILFAVRSFEGARRNWQKS